MHAAIDSRTDGPDSRKGGRPCQSPEQTLSDTAVAELAEQMWIPEGLLRAVIERYPELNRALARRYRASTCTA